MTSNIKNIKVIFSDIDGTLTDGRLLYGFPDGIIKAFYAQDGYGIKLWQKHGGIFGFLSGIDSNASQQRAKVLQIRTNDVGLGIDDKITWMDTWLKDNNFTWKELAYIGDDLNDRDVLLKVGFSGVVKNGIKSLKKECDYICKKSGGRGAVREFIDIIMQEQISSKK